MRGKQIQPTIIRGIYHYPCSTCKQLLPRDEFYWNRRTGLRNTSYCRRCHSARKKLNERKTHPPKPRIPVPAPFKNLNSSGDEHYHTLLLDMVAHAQVTRQTFREVMTAALTRYLRYLARKGAAS